MTSCVTSVISLDFCTNKMYTLLVKIVPKRIKKTVSAQETFALIKHFVETMIHIFSGLLDEQHYFEIEKFCYIIYVFTVTFGRFNASLLNKSIDYFFKKKLNF